MDVERPDGLRCRVMGGRAGIAGLAAALLLTGCSSSSKPPGLGYNTDPIHEAKQLKVCLEPQSYSSSVARCVFGDGAVIAVASVASSSAQSYVAALADDSATGCVVIGKGFEIQADTKATLAAHLNLPDLQSRYHATLHGKC